MKKVLIIGENSYIGKSFVQYASDRLEIIAVGARNGEWKEVDFSNFDSIVCCAGIAHTKATKENEHLYYAVNRDLAIDVATKTKGDGVGQFVFLSSLYVYKNSLKADIVISKETQLNSNTVYGKSKHEAETALQKLSDEYFKICLVRPPMVYGENCKGNFLKLVKLAKMLPIIPNYPNKRSMIYIDNLCEYLCQLIEKESSGVFVPQNSEYVNTTTLVRQIRKAYGKKTLTTSLFNPLIYFMVKRISVINKMFGNLRCEMQGDEDSYKVVGFEEGIQRSVCGSAKYDRPTVSIVTVAFNSGKTIKDTIESVLIQTILPKEYIIVDGDSTDNTVEIAHSYKDIFEEKGINYIIISEKDNGVYDAMNKGISISTGDVVGMINSDDWYEPHTVETAIETFVETNYDMMFADLQIHSKNKVYTKRAKITKWIATRNWNHPTTFTHKRIYEDNKFPCQSIYDDFNLYAKLRKEKKNIVAVNKVLANFRTGGLSSKKSIYEAWKRCKVRYKIYRQNGYSRIYFLECLFMESLKYVLL